IVVFGPERRAGALVGDRVVDLNRGMARYLRERGESNAENRADARLPARLLSLIERGPAGVVDAQAVIGYFSKLSASDDRSDPRVVYNVADVKLHAPWPERRIACVGGNYAAHLAGMWANRLGKTDVSIEQITEEAKKAGQWGFWKVPAEVAGPNDTIPFPKRVTYFDYEGEVAIIIGKRGKNIPAANIREYVWGVTLFHDWSIRDGGGVDRGVSYNLQKNFDGAVSMGPCIVVNEVDHQAVDAETRVNGVVRQSYSTKEMIWSFGDVLEYLSQDFTFVPGDVIAGGTSAGTAADKSRRGPDGKRPLDLFLKIGDSVEVSSPQIGSLPNKIVASE
ncbi:MAG TPA: fumarylacetoacetate hydrolase family protein, partial [Candidatus Binatia bacterium]|nr:fumarylacetoacetate hydrolase family protein [Candidatus Binatia bacterium]